MNDQTSNQTNLSSANGEGRRIRRRTSPPTTQIQETNDLTMVDITPSHHNPHLVPPPIIHPHDVNSASDSAVLTDTPLTSPIVPILSSPSNLMGHSARVQTILNQIYACTLQEKATLLHFLESILKRDFLGSLPPELVQRILSYLDLATIARLEVVCKSWQVHASSEFTWKSLFYRQNGWRILPEAKLKRLALDGMRSDRSAIVVSPTTPTVMMSPTRDRSVSFPQFLGNDSNDHINSALQHQHAMTLPRTTFTSTSLTRKGTTSSTSSFPATFRSLLADGSPRLPLYHPLDLYPQPAASVFPSNPQREPVPGPSSPSQGNLPLNTAYRIPTNQQNESPIRTSNLYAQLSTISLNPSPPLAPTIDSIVNAGPSSSRRSFLSLPRMPSSPSSAVTPSRVTDNQHGEYLSGYHYNHHGSLGRRRVRDEIFPSFDVMQVDGEHLISTRSPSGSPPHQLRRLNSQSSHEEPLSHPRIDTEVVRNTSQTLSLFHTTVPGHSAADEIQREMEVDVSFDWKALFRSRYGLQSKWEQGKCDATVCQGHDDAVYSLQFDDEKLVSGSRDNTIKIWDLRRRREAGSGPMAGVCTHTLVGHEASVLCLQYDDRYLVSGSSDSTVILWDLPLRQPIRTMHGHSESVLNIQFDSRRGIIVSCSKDKSIKIWSVETGTCLFTINGHDAAVNVVQLHEGIVVSGSGDRMIKIWDIDKMLAARQGLERAGDLLPRRRGDSLFFGPEAAVMTLRGHVRGIACIQFDGNLIVSGSSDQTIRVWSVHTGACLSVLTGHTDLVRTIHFNSQYIVSGSYDQSIKVWDLHSGTLVLDLPHAHNGRVFKVALSVTRIVSCSQDKTILIRDFGDDTDDLLFNGR